MPLKTFSALSSTTSFFLPLGILNSPQNLSKLKGSLQIVPAVPIVQECSRFNARWAAQNIVQQRCRCRRRLAVGVDKYSQRIVPRQERFTLGFVDFVDPCTAHFADLANPTHDLDLIVVASRTKIFDLVTSLENHPVAGTQLIERMAGQAYRIVVSLFDPIKKNRVVRPSKGIELVALHLTPVTITVAILHRA